ncbi:MAG: KH domain-containing protein [Candidatus Zipacnadales bacterium]
MQDLIEYLVRELVDNPDQARVEPLQEQGYTVYQVYVAPEDVGKVIGRRGRIANALRIVAKAAGLKQRTRATVEIVS